MEDEGRQEGGKPAQRRAFSFDGSEVIPISPRPPTLALKAAPIDPATEWSEHAVVTAVESSIDRQALIQWVAEQTWEWEQSSELTGEFATRVVDTLLAAFFRSGD